MKNIFINNENLESVSLLAIGGFRSDGLDLLIIALAGVIVFGDYVLGWIGNNIGMHVNLLHLVGFEFCSLALLAFLTWLGHAGESTALWTQPVLLLSFCAAVRAVLWLVSSLSE